MGISGRDVQECDATGDDGCGNAGTTSIRESGEICVRRSVGLILENVIYIYNPGHKKNTYAPYL